MPPVPAIPVLRWQFVRASDPASLAIAWFGGGDFSHIDCIYPDGSCVGARSDTLHLKDGTVLLPGVQRRPPGYLKFARRCVMQLEVTVQQAHDFYDFLDHAIGAPYDSLAIIGFIAGRSWYRDGTYICSELQAAALTKAKIVKPLYLTANRITPNDLTLILSAIGAQQCSFSSPLS